MAVARSLSVAFSLAATLATTLALSLVLGLSFANAAQADDRLKVVATTGMIADAAREIGGDLVEVQALMGPGVDPHAYRQTRSDILAMAKADLVAWNGLYLEAQMEDFMMKLGEKTKTIAIAESVPAAALLGSEDYAERHDPHVWMDPELWSFAVIALRDAMIDAQPEAAEDFTENAALYLADIEKLAQYAGDVLASVPEQSRVVLSAHDAFNYFGAAYDFDVVGIQGISTESEAGLLRISELVDMLVARDIRAIFVETSVSDRNIRALIEGAAAKDHSVVIGGELYSDAMGAPGTYQGTYIGMIDHNATTIAAALGGDAPKAGMQDRLN